MITTSLEINTVKPNVKYSICTLVTNIAEYEGMLASFKDKGFTDENAEFLHINNIDSNQYDGYTGLNHMLNTARGAYVILCHQDILLNFDDESILDHCLSELNQQDPNWALAGNAGGDSHARYRRITDPHGASNLGNFPQKVQSLDENFIIANTRNRVALSGNLSGFHMYGTDLCLMADILGYHAYVIDFHLQHNSRGNKDKSFYVAEKFLIKKFQQSFRSRFIKTTCTKLHVSSSGVLTAIFNQRIFRDLAFFALKIKQLAHGQKK